MPTLFMICGLPGAGKTTLAKQLEISENAFRFCPDEWITSLLKDAADTPEMDRLRDPVESLQWEMAKRVLTLGMNVILENGFWSREERMRFRSQAQALSVRVELRYLDVPRDELWRRLSKRNAELPSGTFPIREDQLDLWLTWFEPPTPDEFE